MPRRHDISICDPVCDQFWHHTWRRISTRNTEIYDEVFKCIPTDYVKTFASLRKYQEEPPLSKSDPELAAQRATEIQVNDMGDIKIIYIIYTYISFSGSYCKFTIGLS